MPTLATRPRTPGTTWASAVAGATALAVLALTACAPGADGGPTALDGVSASEAADPADPAAPEPELREVEASEARRVGSVVPRAPGAVRLPGSDLLDVVEVGTREDGLLDVPPDVDVLGWWEGGSRIGDPFGSVLLAGHVDSEDEGLGPSARLLTVERGDRVEVRAGGRTLSYAVDSRRFVPLDDLASYPRVLSADGPARLTLVTCAPPFLPGRGGYQNLAVVTALPERSAR